jgi:hypothetical protein
MSKNDKISFLIFFSDFEKCSILKSVQISKNVPKKKGKKKEKIGTYKTEKGEIG